MASTRGDEQRVGLGSDDEPGAESPGLLRRYLRRRTPWDVPWWMYVVTIGAANVARQLLFPEMSTATRVVTFVVLVLGVGFLVTVTYRIISGRRAQR